MTPPTFQTRYCERYGVEPGRFRATLHAQTLYPHARLFRPIAERLFPGYFQADYDFIDDVALLRSTEGFNEALACFLDRYENRKLSRYCLRMRISVRRMWPLVSELLAEEANAPVTAKLTRSSASPFGRKKSGPRSDRRSEGPAG